jgi:hypothetical protein
LVLTIIWRPAHSSSFPSFSFFFSKLDIHWVGPCYFYFFHSHIWAFYFILSTRPNGLRFFYFMNWANLFSFFAGHNEFKKKISLYWTDFVFFLSWIMLSSWHLELSHYSFPLNLFSTAFIIFNMYANMNDFGLITRF